jgi:rhomboid protease GluP
VDRERPTENEAHPRFLQVVYSGPDALVASPITRTILMACVLVFAGEVVASHSLQALVRVSTPVALAFGANEPDLVLKLGQTDRLLASCFAHTSLFHLFINMYTLRQVGPLVEPEVGSARYSTLFVVTGIAGSLTSALLGRLLGHHGFTVGASGAICGVMGAAVVVWARVEGWRSWIAWQIGFWLAVTLVLGARLPGIDNAAHVGGLMSGSLMALAWRREVIPPARTAWIVGIASAFCVAAGLRVAWRDRTDPAAMLDLDQRIHLVQLALDRGDCVTALEGMEMAEELGQGAELAGLRKAVEQKCGPPGP